VSLYVTDRFCYKEVKNNCIIKGIARDRAVVSVHRKCRYIKGSVQASFTVFVFQLQNIFYVIKIVI